MNLGAVLLQGANTAPDRPAIVGPQPLGYGDLAFLRERARLLRAEVWVDGDTLGFKTRDRRTATGPTLVQGDHILRLRARADLAHQRTAVRVSGYDANERAAIDEEAGADVVKAEVESGRTRPLTTARRRSTRPRWSAAGSTTCVIAAAPSI